MSYADERAKELIKLMDSEDQKIVEEHIQNRIKTYNSENFGCFAALAGTAVVIVLIVSLCYGIPLLWSATHTERAWKIYANNQAIDLDSCRKEELTCRDELDLWKKLRDKKCSRENNLGR